MLKVDPWILFVLVTPTLLSRSFLIMFMRVIYSGSLHMWHWSPFNVSRSFHTTTWKVKVVSWTSYPLMQMSLGVCWVFSCQVPCQASFRHLKLPALDAKEMMFHDQTTDSFQNNVKVPKLRRKKYNTTRDCKRIGAGVLWQRTVSMK